MKPPTNRLDAKKLAWFIGLLNEGRRAEPSVENSRKPKKELKPKQISPLSLAPTPGGLRAQVGGLLRSTLNLVLGFKGSVALQRANQIAIQAWSAPQFTVDRSGMLRVYRAARPGTGPTEPLLVDAMGVLTHLVETGLHSRLKCCPGYRSPQYRGEPLRRCSLWFDGASNKTYHSSACAKKAERVRNKTKYNARQKKLMRKKRKEEKEERRTFLERERRIEYKLHAGASQPSPPDMKAR